MTADQLQQLKAMSRGEIARKYAKALIRKEITQEQYQWLVEQGTDVSELPQDLSIAPVDSVEAFSGETTHDDQEAGKSQKARLYEVLKDGKEHETPEILGRVYGDDHLGIARIAGRISDLRNDGHEIVSRHVRGTVWSYRMVVKEAVEPWYAK